MFLAVLLTLVGAVWGIANFARKVSTYGPLLMVLIGGVVMLWASWFRAKGVSMTMIEMIGVFAFLGGLGIGVYALFGLKRP